MRTIIVASAVFLACTGAAHAVGIGQVTCGQYLRMKSAGSVNQVNQWMLGYATGANEVARLLTSKNYLASLPPTAIYARVAEYCRANPKIQIQAAAQEFLTYLKHGRGVSASAGNAAPATDNN
jgi:hypothetical protein